MAGIAHVERALDRDRAGRKAILAQLVGRHCFEAPEHRVHVIRRKLIDRRHSRLDVVVFDVRHDEADRRIHSGIERHDHAGHAEVARHAAGMHGTGTAECEQHEVAQVMASHG